MPAKGLPAATRALSEGKSAETAVRLLTLKQQAVLNRMQSAEITTLKQVAADTGVSYDRVAQLACNVDFVAVADALAKRRLDKTRSGAEGLSRVLRKAVAKLDSIPEDQLSFDDAGKLVQVLPQAVKVLRDTEEQLSDDDYSREGTLLLYEARQTVIDKLSRTLVKRLPANTQASFARACRIARKLTAKGRPMRLPKVMLRSKANRNR